jgi:hypothetical protein
MKDIFERLVDHFVGNGFSMDEAVAVLERAMIARALEKTGGNRCAASKMLNVPSTDWTCARRAVSRPRASGPDASARTRRNEIPRRGPAGSFVLVCALA